MNNDHCLKDQPLAYRGYQSFAPTFILTRLLAHYDEIGLSDAQVKQLLNVKKKYRKFILKHWPKLVNNWTELDKCMNAYNINNSACKKLIVKRANLMQQLDEYYLQISNEIQNVITKKQNNLLEEVYNKEKNTYLKSISGPLHHKFRDVSDIFR